MPNEELCISYKGVPVSSYLPIKYRSYHVGRRRGGSRCHAAIQTEWKGQEGDPKEESEECSGARRSEGRCLERQVFLVSCQDHFREKGNQLTSFSGAWNCDGVMFKIDAAE